MADKKVVVLGVDGLEPKIVDSLLKAKKLPSLTQLTFYSELATTIPPQSPVAWASFMTGVEPTQHRLFDFVKRNPKNYQPYLAYSLAGKESAIQAPTFWQATKKIPTKIFFLPDTFPAPKLKGQIISGMGTPDLAGTEGSFQLFSNRKSKKELKRGRLIPIERIGVIKTSILGPQYQSLTKIKTSQVPFKITPKKRTIEINLQGQKIALKVGQFSPWLKVNFKVGWLKSVQGQIKFYLQSIKPIFNLYCSPVNLDPKKSLHPIAFPKKFGPFLAKEYGPFATLGLPHDTWAFQAGIFSQKAFLQQVDDLLKERSRIILGELNKFSKGLFVGYLGTLDSVQHMFWGKTKIINHYYQKIDQLLGRVLRQLSKEDSFFLLSDHGFGVFNWEFHLNAWLRENGYLILKKGLTGGELLENIDWEKTKAYALGFNSLYLNLQGRESQGIVHPKEKAVLIKKVSHQLKSLRTPLNGQKVIKNVYPSEEPDLIIGYYRGYRASWETAVGATPAKIFKKRTEKWRGDHLFDASEVPGVLFSNQKLGLKNPAITDIMPLALKEFGINFPP